MKITHLFAFHGHFGGGGALLLLIVIALIALFFAIWPDKSQTK
jgi:hypothetical protein